MLNGFTSYLQPAVLGLRYHRRQTIGSLAYFTHNKVLGVFALGICLLYFHARRAGGDSVEVEVFITGQVQMDHEVHLEREARERQTHH